MEPRRSLYRARALQAWTGRRDRAVFPRLVSPRLFAALWAALALLGAAGAAVLVHLLRELGG